MEIGQTLNVLLPYPVLDGFWPLVRESSQESAPQGQSLRFEYKDETRWMAVEDRDMFFSDRTPIFGLIKIATPITITRGITITFEEAEEEDEEVEVEVDVSSGGITLTREMVIHRSILNGPQEQLAEYVRDNFGENHFDDIEIEIWWSRDTSIAVDGRPL